MKSVPEAMTAALLLLDKGCRTVVLTLGEQGAVCVSQDRKPIHIPAKKVKQVDSTVRFIIFTDNSQTVRFFLLLNRAQGMRLLGRLLSTSLACHIFLWPRCSSGAERSLDIAYNFQEHKQVTPIGEIFRVISFSLEELHNFFFSACLIIP